MGAEGRPQPDCAVKAHGQEKNATQVWFGQALLDGLPNLICPHIAGQVCVVADENTAAIARSVSAILADKVAEVFVYPGPMPASAEAVAQVEKKAVDSQGLVSVGSGCITDVARLAASRLNLPLFVIATAASMDGYLSAHSAIIVDGYKLTHAAQAPAAVIADTDVLIAAPVRLTRAGLGDVVGKYTSLADWRLSHVMTGEPWCATVTQSVYKAVEKCWQQVQSPSWAVEVMAALLVTGQAMVDVGNSRPASGGEHHISHYWEMLALARGAEGHLHGEYVAVGCVLLAAVYERMLTHKRLAASAAQWQSVIAALCDVQKRQKLLEKGFGTAHEMVAAETKEKDARLWGALTYLEAEERWERSRNLLAGAVPTPQTLVAFLRGQQIAATPAELGIARDDVEMALRCARALRNRFGILDVAAGAGVLDDLARQIAAESLSW